MTQVVPSNLFTNQGDPEESIQHSPENGALPGPFAGANVPSWHDPTDSSAAFRNAARPAIDNGAGGVTKLDWDATAGGRPASMSASTQHACRTHSMRDLTIIEKPVNGNGLRGTTFETRFTPA
jgi:hypothetical protein